MWEKVAPEIEFVRERRARLERAMNGASVVFSCMWRALSCWSLARLCKFCVGSLAPGLPWTTGSLRSSLDEVAQH